VDEIEIFTVAQLHAWSWEKFCGLKLWDPLQNGVYIL